MLKNIKIFDSDVEISQIGFGCARLNDGSEREYSYSLLQAAYENGIKHFDTAPMYQSEEILGKFFEGVGDVTFCSKVGIDPVKNFGGVSNLKRIYRKSFKSILANFPNLKRKLLFVSGAYKPFTIQEEFRHAKIMAKDYVLRSLEITLRHLMRPALDIYLVHEPDLFLLGPDVVEIFEELKSSGYIRSYGLGYGRISLGREIEFGSVVQSRWHQNISNEYQSHTNIYHGVLRDGTSKDMLKLIKSERESALIFSASTAIQIERLMGELGSNN